MLCNTLDNTFKTLRERGVLGDLNHIENMDEFNRLNELYSKTAREKYGVEIGLLFGVESTIIPRSEKYKTPTRTINKAVPSQEAFRDLDQAVEEANQDEQDTLDLQKDAE